VVRIVYATMASKVRAGKPAQVKNKAPAPVQITAEQILREAMERVEAEPKAPKTKIADEDELEHYKYALLQDVSKFSSTYKAVFPQASKTEGL